MRDSVVFYRSFASAIKKLPDEFQLSALWAIIDYGLDEKEPSDNGIAEAIFSMAKPQIDANIKRYNNGLKGGRLKQGENKTEPNSNQKEPNNNQTKTKQSFSETMLEPNEKENENEDKSNTPRRGTRMDPRASSSAKSTARNTPGRKGTPNSEKEPGTRCPRRRSPREGRRTPGTNWYRQPNSGNGISGARRGTPSPSSAARRIRS